MSLGHLNCNFCIHKNKNLFKCMDEERINATNFEGGKKKFPKGSFLFKEGEEANHFFCIKSGKVRTFKDTKTDSSKELTLEVKSGGDWTGSRDVVISERHNHSSICLEDVEACMIPKETLSIAMEDSHFQRELLLQMAKSWRDAEKRMYSLATKKIHSKLAEFLLFLQSSTGKEKTKLSITREVMASIIGVTQESLIRALSDFKHRNWIDVNRSEITFKNIKALHEIAEIDKDSVSY